MTAVPYSRIYLPFAAGYLMSYLFRVVTAVISPDLTRELSLEPGALGLLTAAYFMAFAAMQIPAGILLDRYGPRRVEPVLLVVAAAGAFGFAFAQGLTMLAVARALIGLGAAVCLMAPLKAIATWYPGTRQASLAGWVMVAGGTGALAATTPVEFALRFIDWRTLFAFFGGLTLVVAAAIAWRVPDLPRQADPPSFRTQIAGVRQVFAEPRFWWLVPIASVAMGSFMAIQGLWSVPWLMEVEGRSRAQAATFLFWMGFATLVSYFALGLFATRLAHHGIATRHIYLAGWVVHIAAFVAIVVGLPWGLLWWSLHGAGAAVNILAFTLLNEGFPSALAGRANTAANLTMFGGTFIVQWGIGVVVQRVRDQYGLTEADGLRVAFAIVLVLVLVAFAWFLAGWRRYAAPPVVRV